MRSKLIVDPAAITNRIRQKALELGIDKIGIVPSERLDREGELLREWLSLGFQGEMRWMERDPEVRTDPDALLDGAKTVIVVAVNYFTPEEHGNDPGKGKVSRYAWGDDYHDVVRRKLVGLVELITELIPGVKAKICVDTSPMLEKAWAVKAGIGWLGKHTNVITKDLGSWVFLGEVIIDAELVYDTEPVEDHCGSCTACIDACPTDAIVEPYLVDSNRCISYATIELRTDKLPGEVAGNLEGWFYGCDICQDVCPWNKFRRVTDEPGFRPRPGNVDVDLDEIANLGHDEYVERFRGSAMKRAKLSGLQRNARALKESELDND